MRMFGECAIVRLRGEILPKTSEVFVQGAIHALTGAATLVLAAGFVIAGIIAVGGTGGFTSDQPPEHSAWIALAVILGLWAVFQSCLVRTHFYLLAALDRRCGRDGRQA
jgi:hypothetical protein